MTNDRIRLASAPGFEGTSSQTVLLAVIKGYLTELDRPADLGSDVGIFLHASWGLSTKVTWRAKHGNLLQLYMGCMDRG